VTLLVTDSRPIGAPVLELKDEYEAATGATLDVVRMPREDLYGYAALGELSLDGTLNPVAGVLPAAIGASTMDLA